MIASTSSISFTSSTSMEFFSSIFITEGVFYMFLKIKSSLTKIGIAYSINSLVSHNPVSQTNASMNNRFPLLIR